MITIKKFVFNPIQVNTFILHDETKECIIIDPGCSADNELELLDIYIRGNNLRPVKIYNTHSHFDHIMGNGRVSEKYQVEVCLSAEDMLMYNMSTQSAGLYGIDVAEPPVPSGFIKEGDLVKFGNTSLQVIEAPGHSPGSLLFYSKEQKIIIVGDVLFSGSIGRTDLPGGDMTTLLKSISDKILSLDDNVIVYCGHGPETNVGLERRTNPFLNERFI